MKKNMLKIVLGIIIVSLVVAIALFIILKPSNDSDDTGNNDTLKTVTHLGINEKKYVNSLEKITIDGTNDYFIITNDVKWNPQGDGETTVSFSINIPYVITVDGNDYTGNFILSDHGNNSNDNNPKYSFSVTNLTADGKIEVEVSEK